jgi:hypothetical protein
VSKRLSKPLVVERRAIKPSGRKPETRIRSFHELANLPIEKLTHEEYKSLQLAPSPIAPKLGLIEEYVEKLRRMHNDPDAMRNVAQTVVSVQQAEKAAWLIEQWDNGTFIRAKVGCSKQLGMWLSKVLASVPVGSIDYGIPDRPRGLRPWIKDLKP